MKPVQKCSKAGLFKLCSKCRFLGEFGALRQQPKSFRSEIPPVLSFTLSFTSICTFFRPPLELVSVMQGLTILWTFGSSPDPPARWGGCPELSRPNTRLFHLASPTCPLSHPWQSPPMAPVPRRPGWLWPPPRPLPSCPTHKPPAASPPRCRRAAAAPAEAERPQLRWLSEARGDGWTEVGGKECQVSQSTCGTVLLLLCGLGVFQHSGLLSDLLQVLLTCHGPGLVRVAGGWRETNVMWSSEAKQKCRPSKTSWTILLEANWSQSIGPLPAYDMTLSLTMVFEEL